MRIKLPTQYDVDCLPRNAAYYTGKERVAMKRLLIATSQGYCMYCGKILSSDKTESFQIEHSVDKAGNYNQNSNALTNCKYNLAATCSLCNQIYKKRVEKLDFTKYQIPAKCPTICSQMCEEYKKMREDYCKENAIILQPHGYVDKTSTYEIGYNIFSHIYEADGGSYSPEALFFIENHIARFHLNGAMYSESIIDICVEICDFYEKGIRATVNLLDIEKNRQQSNIIGKKFVDHLIECFTDEKVEKLIDYCKMIVVLSVI